MNKSSKEYAEKRANIFCENKDGASGFVETLSSVSFQVGYLDAIEQTGVEEKDKEIERLRGEVEKANLAFNQIKEHRDELSEKFEYEVECNEQKDADLNEMARLLKKVISTKQGYPFYHEIKEVISKYPGR